MANREKGEVTVQQGDKTYTLRLGMNELCEIEGATGIKMGALSQELASGSAILSRAAFWAALHGGGHTDIGLTEVGQIISELGIQAATLKLMDAFSVAFPTEETNENPE